MLIRQLLAAMASFSAATALAVTPSIQTTTFNPESNTNMAVYWVRAGSVNSTLAADRRWLGSRTFSATVGTFLC